MSFDFEVKADASQALRASQQVEGSLKNVEGQAQKTTKAMSDVGGGLGDVIALAGQLVALHTAEELVDGYTMLSNKMRSVSDSQDNLNGIMDETYAIAQRTRASWEDTANAFTRLQVSTSGLGVSQREVLTLTENLSMGLRISGASAFEAQMTMMELTHAFATGALTGREYRVVMKDAPLLMREIQKASGKTGAEFAEMGKHSKITGESLMEWVTKAAPAIKERFDATFPTITEMILKVHNAAEKFFGEAGAGSGVMRTLGAAADWLAKNFDVVGKVVLAVGEAFVGLYVIKEVITLVQMLGAAIASNPIGALGIALVTGILLLRQFGDSIEVARTALEGGGSIMMNVADYLHALWIQVIQLKDAVIDFVESAWHTLSDAFSDGLDTDGIQFSLSDAIHMLMSFVFAAEAIFTHFKDIIVIAFGAIPMALTEAFASAFPGIVRGLEKIVNTVIDAVNGLAAIGGAAESNEWQKRQQEIAAKSSAEGQRLLAINAQIQAKGPSADLTAQQHDAMGKIRGYSNVNKLIQGNIDRAEGNLIPFHIELDKEALKGAGDNAKELIKDTMDDINADIRVKLSEFDRDARTHAAERAAEKARGATISDTHGVKDPKKESDKDKEKAAKEMEKLLKALEQLRKQSNPIIEAQLKMADAEDVLTRALAKNKIGVGDAEKVLADLRESLRAALDPMGAFVDKQLDEFVAMSKNDDERKRSAEILDAENDLRAKGLTLTDAQISQIEHLINKKADLAKQNEIDKRVMEETTGYAKTYAENVEALTRLHGVGKINAYEYGKAIRATQDAFDDATGASLTFENGLNRGMRSIRDEILDVAKVAETALTNAFHSVENAIVDLVVKGKANWSAMVDSMLADLTRLIMRQIEAKLITSAIGSGGLPGFATGGSFMVGGNGGTDTSVVAFRATPGERVTVENPNQVASASSRNGGGGSSRRSGNINVVNSIDPSYVHAAMDSPEGERLVLNIIDRNRKLRGYTSRS